MMARVEFTNPFRCEGAWLRGAIHVHTTASDGLLSPEQALIAYKARGYDFVVIADHWRLTPVDDVAPSVGIVAIPGEELSVGRSLAGTSMHVVAVGLSEELSRERASGWDAQRAIDAVREGGGEALIAHPSWSDLCFADLLGLEGYLGVEVYNTNCDVSAGKGWSWSQWLGLLSSGKLVYGVAADDAHWGSGEHSRLDAFGGWVLVKAGSADADSVLRALRSGMFYSSTGPEILDVEVRGDEVVVRTSPVRAVTFLSREGHGRRYEAVSGGALTEVRHGLSGRERFVVVACEDWSGRVAWTNPMRVLPD